MDKALLSILLLLYSLLLTDDEKVMHRLLQRSMDAQWALMHSEELDEDPVELHRNFERAIADVNAFVSEHFVSLSDA